MNSACVCSPHIGFHLRPCLQGHVDMVAEKNSGVAHDFSHDPLQLQLGSDGWLRAVGTTLGAGAFWVGGSRHGCAAV
jgi:di/tripeptidase